MPRCLSAVGAHKDREPYEPVPLCVQIAPLWGTTALHTWVACFDGQESISEAHMKLFQSHSFLSSLPHTTLRALSFLSTFSPSYCFPSVFFCYVLCSFLLLYFGSILFPFPSFICFFFNSSFCTYSVYVPAHSFHIRERKVSSRTFPDSTEQHKISRTRNYKHLNRTYLVNTQN